MEMKAHEGHHLPLLEKNVSTSIGSIVNLIRSIYDFIHDGRYSSSIIFGCYFVRFQC